MIYLIYSIISWVSKNGTDRYTFFYKKDHNYISYEKYLATAKHIPARIFNGGKFLAMREANIFGLWLNGYMLHNVTRQRNLFVEKVINTYNHLFLHY